MKVCAEKNIRNNYHLSTEGWAVPSAFSCTSGMWHLIVTVNKGFFSNIWHSPGDDYQIKFDFGRTFCVINLASGEFVGLWLSFTFTLYMFTGQIGRWYDSGLQSFGLEEFA